jgi:hypothetical protein
MAETVLLNLLTDYTSENLVEKFPEIFEVSLVLFTFKFFVNNIP